MNPLIAKPVVIITGPTGVGKSHFAENLATSIDGVIVNGDVGQLYAPLAIGTAKPDISRATVPHYLFNYLDEPKNLTAVAYRDAVQHIIAAQEKVPIIVGGSGFYLLSLFFPPHKSEPYKEAPDLTHVPANVLWQELNRIDPARAAKIPQHDAYRLRRALTIWYTTGKIPSHQVPQFSPIAPAIIVHITRPREILYARINERTRDMFKQGWVKEVKNLTLPWQEFLTAKGLIGYPEIIAHLRGQGPHDEEQLVAVIQKKTRNYAKRQETFWRMLRARLEAHVNTHQGPPIVATRELVLTTLDDRVYLQQLAHDVATTINEWNTYAIVGNARP